MAACSLPSSQYADLCAFTLRKFAYTMLNRYVLLLDKECLSHIGMELISSTLYVNTFLRLHRTSG